MFERVLTELKNYDTIIIHRHTNPDGDALGCQIGLKQIILDNFPNKMVYVVGDPAKRYAFMDGSTMDEIADETYDGALAFVLDCGSSSLVNDDRYKKAAKTVRIDHHIYCETFTDVEVVDTSFESCCGMIAQFALESKLALSPASAKALYTGMVTDSGRFRYDCTNAQTFRLASALLETKFDLNDVYANLYADDFAYVRLRAQYTLKIRFTPENVAYIYTTKEELAASGADSFTISRGMVGVMADLRGVDVWVNFTETDEKVLVEIRSSKYEVQPIAVKYGGGGHAKACGASVADKATAMALLEDLNKIVREANE